MHDRSKASTIREMLKRCRLSSNARMQFHFKEVIMARQICEVVSTKIWHPGSERFVTSEEHDALQRSFNSPESIEKQVDECLKAPSREERKAIKEEERKEKKSKDNSDLVGKHITAKAMNLRKQGSRGAQSFQIILDNPGIVFEEYIAKGGRVCDIRWDMNKNWVEVK